MCSGIWDILKIYHILVLEKSRLILKKVLTEEYNLSDLWKENGEESGKLANWEYVYAQLEFCSEIVL